MDAAIGPDFRITLENGIVVTVAEVLQNRQRYHLNKTLTPGEDEYHGGAPTGIIYTVKQTAVLHTQAHGGTTYTLLPFDSEQLTKRQLGKPVPVSDPLPSMVRQNGRLWPSLHIDRRKKRVAMLQRQIGQYSPPREWPSSVQIKNRVCPTLPRG
jgi:hypothetical protein